MSIFDKWTWIKRNWTYIIEEATKMELVFVGGTSLNLAIFEENLLFHSRYLISLFFIKFMLSTKKTSVTTIIQTKLSSRKTSVLPRTNPLARFTT